MEKDRVMAEAPNGVIGMESAFPVLYTDLVLPGIVPLGLLVEKMALGACRVLGIEKGTLAVGADADVAVLDLDAEFTLDADAFESRSRNCPFTGRKLRGKPVATIVGGRVVFRDGQILV
jgi:dihydroorotase